MAKDTLSKYSITRNNGHLLDVFSSSSYVECGTIDFDVMTKILNYEVVTIKEISNQAIQNKGIGQSLVENEELKTTLPFLFFENLHIKNRALQLFLTYGIIKHKTERQKEIFTPVLLIPVNIYIEKDNIFVQQISRPVENPILVSFLASVKKINISIPEKLDDIYAIDRFCLHFEKHEGLKLKYENYITFAFLKDSEIKIKHEKFSPNKQLPDYLYDKLFSKQNQDNYYFASLNRAQRYVIENAKNENSFVVSGRLGTGKTTALINVAMNAINEGKRVLYLSNLKDTLDKVHDVLEEQRLSQYLVNFSNLYAKSNKWESSMNPKAYSAKEEMENLFANYEFVNNYEKAMAERILDHRFIDVVNELIDLQNQEHQLLDIDYLLGIYKSEFLQITSALEIIQTSLSKISSFQNSTWKDIPIYNNVKYPNQIVSLIYQIHKCFKILDDEKQVLEHDFGFSTITNYAFLKNMMHSFNHLNVREVPESWKEPTYQTFQQAKVSYKQLKEEIYQLQEMEKFLVYKYEQLDHVSIKQEIENMEGHYFTEADLDSINLIFSKRMDLIVLVNKCLMQEDVLKKSVEKVKKIMNWEFALEDEIIFELSSLNEFLQNHQINGKLLNAIYSRKFTPTLDFLTTHLNKINELQAQISLFKHYQLYANDLDETMQVMYRYQNDDHTLKKREIRWIKQYEKKHPEEFLEVINRLDEFYALKKQVLELQELFMQTSGFPANSQVIDDFEALSAYIESIEQSKHKEQIKHFLDLFIGVVKSDYREMRNQLKMLDLFHHSYNDLLTYYNELYGYPFGEKKSTLINILDDIHTINNYLTKAYASNDRLFEATRSTTEKYIHAEEFYALNRHIDKINELQTYLKKHSLNRSLFQDFYQNEKSNLSAISRVLQAFESYLECFATPEAMIASLDVDVNEKISGHLSRCSDISNEISEIFTVYFKIFRDDVSKYYYDTFENNIKRMSVLLKSKDELINYLIITDNLQIIGKYRLDKLIDYVIHCEDSHNLVVDFKYTYFTALKNYFLEKHSYLQNFKSLIACLDLSMNQENMIIKRNKEVLARNLKKITSQHYYSSNIKNLDYQGYLKKTKYYKRLVLAPTQVLNNFLKVEAFDLVIIDDAHLLNANEYYLAIEGKQVIVAGEMQLLSIVANNLMSRLSFATTIFLNYRFSQTPKRLLNNLHNLRGRINTTINDNDGLEIITSKLISYIVMLIKENSEVSINLFVQSIDKQKRLYDEIAEGLLKMGYHVEQIVLLLKRQINVVDLRLSYMHDADYNILMLEDYYKLDNENIVVNLIDNLLLCKRRLVVFDSNDYLKRGTGFRFVVELNKIINNNQIFFNQYSTLLLQQLAQKLTEHKINVFSSNNDIQLLIQKGDFLVGILLVWSNSNFTMDILEQYRTTYLLNKEQGFPIILVGIMELLAAFDDTVNRIIAEVQNE